ncbi:hypothetical protein MKZ38_000180 [Zalerion maritima]|uniref:Oxidase ustYa n=1 Tax=Zalerion maritima TaxID=339359 RepID=A0AAD5RJC2_9PEZI|nr:hypothetical protein MKZ38_000180 [Zalerion maritima]
MEAKHEYETVPVRGGEDSVDHASSRSSTEVESLMGAKTQWQLEDMNGTRRQPKRTRWMSCLNTCRWAFNSVMLVLIFLILVRNQLEEPLVNEHQFGGDFTGVGPRFSEQIVKFEMDPSYAPTNTSEFFTDEILDKWNKLMPLGMGFVWVNDTHKYHDLPHPIEWPEKTVFTTSVTHQLHCLFAVVQTYSGLTSGHEIPDDHHWHMIHCFDYMRQAIMCNADLALEGHATTFPDDNTGSDGWDSKHVCKDYDEVKAYLESVRAYDDQQIY